MGDPFSVAGTAIGITSLGIQTFQIIVRYYKQYKGSHDDIDDILCQAEDLRDVLETLRETKAGFVTDHSEPFSKLQMALKGCEDSLSKIESMAGKFMITRTKECLQARLSDTRRRLLWSFKKETLKDRQSSLTVFRDNLTLALQYVGLETTLRQLDNLKIQSTRTEQTFDCQDGALQNIHQGVTALHITQHEGNSSLAREPREIKSICRLLANIRAHELRS